MALFELLKGIPGHALVWLLSMLFVGIFYRKFLVVQLFGKLKGFIFGSFLNLLGLASLLLLVELPGQTLLPFSKMRYVLSFILSCSIIIRHKVLDVLLCYSGLFVDLMTLLPVG